jgi:Ca-activated chloride channel family protein
LLAALTIADLNVKNFAGGAFPLAVAIGLDRSFSVPRERLNAATTASRTFIQALRRSDQVTVLAIGSEVEVLVPLSASHVAAMDALETIDPWGTTPLYDAIQSASGRRALILISDGDDRYSRTGATELVEQARRRDVLVYPVATGRTRPPVFAELAAVTGGRSFQAADRRALQTTLASIARELRFQYLLGYTPARPAGDRPQWRSIKVTVNRPNVRVRARDGYIAR